MKKRPRYETFVDKGGEARWRLFGANGEKMAASEAYDSEANAERGIRDHQAAVAQTIEEVVMQAVDEVARPVGPYTAERVAERIIELLAAET